MDNKKPVPQNQPRIIPTHEVAQALNVSLGHHDWGEKKLSQFLVLNNICWLSPSTLGRIKKKLKEMLAGHKLTLPMSYEFINPNDAWALDFLQFEWGLHTLYILVILDDCSRFVLNWSVTSHPTTQLVKELLTETFAIYGLPKVVKTDNGPQFRKQLAEFLNNARIEHYPSPFRTPTFNGKIERLYGDIRTATESAGQASTIEECISIIGKALYEHNYIRPHQALGGITPYQRYAGLEEHIKEQIKRFKEQLKAQKTNKFTAKRLWTPGSPKTNHIQKNILLPGKSGNKTKGLIVPVKSKNTQGKIIGFVRQSFAV